VRSAEAERALVRQSLIHHRKREEQLEQLLADLVAHRKPKCRCKPCRLLRDLARELET
jgi:hypothetical protein